MKIAVGAATIAVALAMPMTAQRQRAAPPVGQARVEILSTEVDFGSNSGQAHKELPSAITVRVFSPGPWSLRLLPTSQLKEHERGQAIGWDRLEWRTRAGAYQPVLPIGFVVARGRQTPPAGELVLVDLRIAFSDSDPLGKFGGSLRIALDAW